eukprot:TRINITY_DN3778_c0_g1_i4.p2 TRINITY_DN3778_c0_g1~~TRINITY_DN3778_c0_g1_i4.p2  ORF type:complete len:289 (-),score=31.04 TRINITY_DN3778_c0_g1_i4:2152-3018(-)
MPHSLRNALRQRASPACLLMAYGAHFPHTTVMPGARISLGEAVHRLRNNDPSLVLLTLSHQTIGDEGAGRLADALRGNTVLEALWLKGNAIGARGARLLAGALRGNTTLQQLDLWGNTMGDEGAGLLADALRVNTALQHLDLSLNEIGDEGARRLAEGLRVNTALKKLYLSANNIQDEGVKYLAYRLCCNITLQTVQLSFPNPPQLDKILDRNDRLRRNAAQHRKLVFVWCVQIRGHLPLELIDMAVRESVWDHNLAPHEMQAFLSAAVLGMIESGRRAARHHTCSVA